MTLALLLPASTVNATQNHPVTEGQVTAHFNNYEPGANIADKETPAAENAAVAGWFDGAIRPFPGSPWDGEIVQCVEDWHVLLIRTSADAIYGFTNRSDSVEFLAAENVVLKLNGEPLEVQQTPVREFKDNSGWWHQTGAFFAPGELPVGTYTFDLDMTHDWFPGEDWGLDPITFEVGAADSAACA
jgi:hypothetical protein